MLSGICVCVCVCWGGGGVLGEEPGAAEAWASDMCSSVPVRFHAKVANMDVEAQGQCRDINTHAVSLISPLSLFISPIYMSSFYLPF